MTSFTQFRIARPTHQLDKIIHFYKNGIGLPQIGAFNDHDGFTGIMLGLPDANYHLEFTQLTDATPCLPPSTDNLLVFYYPDTIERNKVSERLFSMGAKEVEPENPYWKDHGITIEDPDGWRIVLMEIKGFDL
jgi:hypothetical protein